MNRRYLTFWHRSGVTPYTSSCEFAGSCVFDKQLPGILLLQPLTLASSGRVLFRSYDCFFAEFLGDLSLVRLALLELTTCVGLRYDFRRIMFREFSWKPALIYYLCRSRASYLSLESRITTTSGFSCWYSSEQQPKSNNGQIILESVISSHSSKVREY
jgi:hypothetical protein